jgi:MFS family permease
VFLVAVFLGMLLGALAGGGIADTYGRRVTYLLMTLAVGGFSLFSSVSSTFWGLAACRFGVGLGLGAAPAALSLYAEFLPTAARGAGIMSFFMFFSIGAVLQSGLAWATLSNLPPEIGWRVMTAVSSLPCCVLFVLAVCGIVPESPRFLLSKGRANEALSVLQQAAITNDIKDWKLGVEEISDLDSERDPANRSSSQWRMLCSNGPVLRSLVILSFTFVIMAGLYYVLMLLTNIIIVAAATGRTGKECMNQVRMVFGDVTPTVVACVDAETIFGCITMTATDFVLAMLVNSAEIPGLLIARRLIDRIGRRLTVSHMSVARSSLLLVHRVVPDSFRPVCHVAKQVRSVWCMHCTAVGVTYLWWRQQCSKRVVCVCVVLGACGRPGLQSVSLGPFL